MRVAFGNSGVTGSSLVDYVDQWDGYTEAQQFVFDSDRFRFKLNGDGTGTVVLGESQVYPAATDPNVGYPPGEDLMSAVVKVGQYRGGFEYPVHDVIVQSKRIRFKVSPNDFFKGWCELQTPVAIEKGARFGHFTKGVIYGLIGALSLQVAIGNGGQVAGQREAVRMMKATPGTITNTISVSFQFRYSR